MDENDRPEPRSAGRGRPVSQQSRLAALAAAAEVLRERGWNGFSVDEVVRRSGVGKATVYRHWAGGFPLAIEAWGAVATAAATPAPTADAIADLRDLVGRLAAFYASDDGAVAAQLLGAAASHADGGRVVDAGFFGARRTATRAIIEDGVSTGQIRDDVDPDLLIDLLFGPIVFRLFNGRGALHPTEAVRLADLVLPKVSTAADRTGPTAEDHHPER